MYRHKSIAALEEIINFPKFIAAQECSLGGPDSNPGFQEAFFDLIQANGQ
jgi:hypothetical protein